MLYKQRDLAFFQPSTYAVALFVCRLPFMFVEAGLFCCIIYFWVSILNLIHCMCTMPVDQVSYLSRD